MTTFLANRDMETIQTKKPGSPAMVMVWFLLLKDHADK